MEKEIDNVKAIKVAEMRKKGVLISEIMKTLQLSYPEYKALAALSEETELQNEIVVDKQVIADYIDRIEKLEALLKEANERR